MLSRRVLSKFCFRIGSICRTMDMEANINKPVDMSSKALTLKYSKLSMSSSSIEQCIAFAAQEQEKRTKSFLNGRNDILCNVSINDSNYFISEILTSETEDTQKCLFSNNDIDRMAAEYGFYVYLPLLVSEDDIYCLVFCQDRLEQLDVVNGSGYCHIFDVVTVDSSKYKWGTYLAPYKIMIKSEMFRNLKDKFENFMDDELVNEIKQNQQIIQQVINDNEARLIRINL